MKKSGEKSPKKDDEKQSQKFIETAKKLESDESGKEFEEVIKTISNNKIKH